jgi:hypothetical protein
LLLLLLLLLLQISTSPLLQDKVLRSRSGFLGNS